MCGVFNCKIIILWLAMSHSPYHGFWDTHPWNIRSLIVKTWIIAVHSWILNLTSSNFHNRYIPDVFFHARSKIQRHAFAVVLLSASRCSRRSFQTAAISMAKHVNPEVGWWTPFNDREHELCLIHHCKYFSNRFKISFSFDTVSNLLFWSRLANKLEHWHNV